MGPSSARHITAHPILNTRHIDLCMDEWHAQIYANRAMAQLMNQNYRSCKDDCDRAILQVKQQQYETMYHRLYSPSHMHACVAEADLSLFSHPRVRVSQVPLNVKAYYRKARACQALHQHEEAIQACEAGLKAARLAGGDVEAASQDLRAVRDKVRT